MAWNGWPLSRVIVLFTGAAYLMIFVQVTMFHSRQNFRNPTMWLPVIGGPLIGLTAIVFALANVQALLVWLRVFLWIGTLGGVIGFVYHFRGVGQRVDGFATRNFLVGPPVVLPLMFGALGVLGLLATYWR